MKEVNTRELVTDDSLVGRRLDEYRLEALLGQGGMARVYRGLDVRLNRWVAVKVIDKPFRADQDYTRRFEQEAQAMSQLEHPHIVRLYRYGEADGLLYMVLQYIEGLGLDQLLASYRQAGEFIEPAEASRIIREMGSALDYAHGKGVVHRDVKPSNIILNQQGQAILVDFGLALLTDRGSRGEVFGTPYYMAPEQVRSSSHAVPQSDLYALGVILYEMFTGRVPFEAEEPLDVAILHLTEPPPSPREFRPDLSPTLEAILLKALGKEPEERYSSGLALANVLDRALKIAPPERLAVPPPTLSHLSIPERVRVGLAKQPLPPPPELVETQPAPAQFSFRVEEIKKTGQGTEAPPEFGSAKAPAPVNKPLSVYIGVGLGLIISISLIVGAFLLVRTLLQSPGGVANPLEPPPLFETRSPPPPPSAPQLVADTQQDFSSVPGGTWEYLWSEADENDIEAMQFEERKYGTCWYAEDYVRICPSSGHPGNDADIAWRWISDFSGHITVFITAHKIDQGGDGVVILAYHNSQTVQGLRLEPDDIQGVIEKPFFEADVKEGDQIIFVMKKNERDEYDHTVFQAQIYRQ